MKVEVVDGVEGGEVEAKPKLPLFDFELITDFI